MSKVSFTENIEIQSELRFRGYSLNTLNIYTRRPWGRNGDFCVTVGSVTRTVDILTSWLKAVTVVVVGVMVVVGCAYAGPT